MKQLTPILLVAIITLLLVGGYTGAYLWLGTKFGLDYEPATSLAVLTTHWGDSNRFVRIYRYHWQAKVFAPAAWVESKLQGSNGITVGPFEEFDLTEDWLDAP